MKKYIMGLLLVAGSGACEGEVLRYSLENIEIVKEGGGVIYLEGGQEIPVMVSSDGMIQVSDQSPFKIKLNQNIFIKLDEESELLFSTDMNVWRPFLEMFAGTISAETQAIEDMAGFGLHLDLSLKE